MTSLAALLASLLLSQGATREAARVVSGPRRFPPGALLTLGQPLSLGPAEHLELLTQGRCLVRLAPGSLARLDPPSPGARCPTLRLLSGAAGILAQRRPDVAMSLELPKGTFSLHHGVGTLRAGAGTSASASASASASTSASTSASASANASASARASASASASANARASPSIQGLCLEHGLASARSGQAAPAPPAPAAPAPAAPAPAAPAPAAPAPAAPAPAAPAPAAPQFLAPGSAAPTPAAEIRSGQCLWLSSGSPTPAPYAEEATARDRALVHATFEPPLAATLPAPDLKGELARLKERGLAGERGGTEVEGGGQSMCLETGGEGGAGDIGTGGSVEIVKPPPPTRLHLRVVIGR